MNNFLLKIFLLAILIISSCDLVAKNYALKTKLDFDHHILLLPEEYLLRVDVSLERKNITFEKRGFSNRLSYIKSKIYFDEITGCGDICNPNFNGNKYWSVKEKIINKHYGFVILEPQKYKKGTKSKLCIIYNSNNYIQIVDDVELFNLWKNLLTKEITDTHLNVN